MDNLTHTLIGVTMANAGLKQRFGRGTTWILAIASNLPDLDIFAGFFLDTPSWTYRRMLTHSIIGVPLLAGAFGALFHLRFKNLSIRTAALLCLLAMGVHVFFDAVNSYGVVVLYPFSRARFELGWIFIIDLAIWAILLAPFLLYKPMARFTSLLSLSRIVIGALACYLCGAAILRWQAGRQLTDWSIQNNVKPEFAYVFPEALGPHRWRGVVRYDNKYRTFVLRPLSGAADSGPAYLTRPNSLDVLAIQQTPMGKAVDWFAKAPVWQPTLVPGEPGVTWSAADLRFSSLIINRGNPFTYEFHVGPDGIRFLGRHSRELQTAPLLP